MKLVDGRIAYVFRWLMGPRPSLRSGLKEYECLEDCEKDVILDVHLELVQFRDSLKDQGNELIEFNLVEEKKKMLNLSP